MHTDEKSVLCVNMHTIDVTVQYTGVMWKWGPPILGPQNFKILGPRGPKII